MVLGAAADTRSGGIFVLGFGVFGWYLAKNFFEWILSGGKETKKLPPDSGIATQRELLEFRHFQLLRERLVRGYALGALTAEEFATLNETLGLQERTLWRRLKVPLPSGSSLPSQEDWIQRQLKVRALRETAASALVSVSLTGPFPLSERAETESEGALFEPVDSGTMAVPQSLEVPPTPEKVLSPPAPVSLAESTPEVLFLNEEGVAEDLSSPPIPEPVPGREQEVAPGIVAWVPEETPSEETPFQEDPSRIPGEPALPTPGMWDRFKELFMQEGQVRWAEACFALFTVLAFVTGVVSVGYYWGSLNPFLRFALLVLGAFACSLFAGFVSRQEGLEETGRTLAIISHLLAPVALGALPFLVGPEISVSAFVGAEILSAFVLGFGLNRVSQLAFGDSSEHYSMIFLGATFCAALLPELLVHSPFRGLLLSALLMTYVSWEGTKTGPGTPRPGGRLLRLCFPVYLMAVATAVAAAAGGAALPLPSGAYAFCLSAAAYLLWTAALAEGAGGATFPGLPLGLQALGFSGMALAVGASLVLEPTFFGNAWLLACLLPPFLASTQKAIQAGAARPAYVSSILLTLMSVLAAGPQLGGHSTLILFPVAGCILGALLLEARGPGASRAYGKTGCILLAYVFVKGVFEPAEGLLSSVALFTFAAPVAAVIRLRAAVQVASLSVAGILCYGSASLYVLPARAGLSALGLWGAALASTPWLLLSATLLSGLQAVAGSQLEAKLRRTRQSPLDHEEALGLWHAPLVLLAIPGLLVGFLAASGLTEIEWFLEPGILPQWWQCLGLVGCVVSGFPRAEKEKRGAGQVVTLAAQLALAVFGAWIYGYQGLALACGVGALLAAHRAALVAGGGLGGAPQVNGWFPFPFACFTAQIVFLFFIVLPDLSASFVEPFGSTPPVALALGAGLMVLAGAVLHRGMPFAMHMHLAPLWVGYGVASLSQYLPDSQRAGLIAMSAAVMAIYGLTTRWQAFERLEASGGGGPVTAGYRPMVDGPFFMASVVGILGAPLWIRPLSRTAWNILFGLLSSSGRPGWDLQAASAVWILLGFGIVWTVAGSVYPRLHRLGLLGGIFAALGLTHVIDLTWWTPALRPTCTVLSAGLATCLLELLVYPLKTDEGRASARNFRIGSMFLIGLIGLAGLWLAVHMHQYGPVYDSLRWNWRGGALTLAVFFASISAWGRAVRGTRAGTTQISIGFCLTIGLAGAWLGGLVGAACGFALATGIAAELGARFAAGSGLTQVGGSRPVTLSDPLPLATLVSAYVFTFTILVPDLIYDQLPYSVAPAVLSLIFSGYRLNRAAPFSMHLHTGALYLFYALWMGTRPLPLMERAAAMGGMGFLVALVGFTEAWNRFRKKEAEAGGGPATQGFLPLVDVTLCVAAVVLWIGHTPMLRSLEQSLAEAPFSLFKSLQYGAAATHGILPLLGFGAILVAARARAKYVKVLAIGYVGGGALLAGLGAGIAAIATKFVGGVELSLTRMAAICLAAWLLDMLAQKVQRAEAPDTPRHLRFGSAVGLLVFSMAFFDLVDRGVSTKVFQATTAALCISVAQFCAASALAMRMGLRGPWGVFAWAYGWIGLGACHLLGLWIRRSYGLSFPNLEFDYGYMLLWSSLSGPTLGLLALPQKTKSFGRHLGAFLTLLGVYASGAYLGHFEELGWDFLAFSDRRAFFGAAVVAGIVALWKRGEASGRHAVWIATPLAYLGFGFYGVGLSLFVGLLFQLATALSAWSLLSWFYVSVYGAASSLLAFSMVYLSVGAEPALYPAAVLGLAFAASALERLSLTRAVLPEETTYKIFRAHPAPLMSTQAGTLKAIAGFGLLTCLIPPLIDIGWMALGFSPLFPPDASSILYGVLVTLAFTALMLGDGDEPVAVCAGMSWIWTGQLVAQALVGPVPTHAWHAAGAMGCVLTAAALGGVARRLQKDATKTMADGFARASTWGCLLLLPPLYGSGLSVSGGVDFWHALAAIAPTIAGVHLFYTAYLRQETNLVYAGEVGVGLTFAYLRWVGVLQGTFYGQIALQVVAFLLLGMAEKAQGGGKWNIFHEPFRRSAMVVPILVMIRSFLGVDWLGYEGWGHFSLGAMASAFYGLVGLREDNASLRYVSGGCLYLGLSLLCYHHYDLREFWKHLDFYVVPLGMLIILFSVLEQKNLLEEQQKKMRTVGLLLIYISPALHAVWGASALQTIALIVLGMMGTLFGVVTKLNLFTLYGMVATALGSAAYLLNIVQMARWSFAFLTFSTLAIGTGLYSAWARKKRNQVGLDGSSLGHDLEDVENEIENLKNLSKGDE